MKNRIVCGAGIKLPPSRFFILLKSNGHSDTFTLTRPAGGGSRNITDRVEGPGTFLVSSRAHPGYPSTCCISFVRGISLSSRPNIVSRLVSREPNDPHTSSYGPASFTGIADFRPPSITRRLLHHSVRLI